MNKEINKYFNKISTQVTSTVTETGEHGYTWTLVVPNVGWYLLSNPRDELFETTGVVIPLVLTSWYHSCGY